MPAAGCRSGEHCAPGATLPDFRLGDDVRRFPHTVWRDARQIATVVESVVEAHGRIDILVNNAGVAPGAPVEELSEETWDLNLDVNLKGTFLMCRAVAPVMKRQRGGRIINAASFAAILPITGSAAYAASKAGVHFFTPEGKKVGFVPTPENSSNCCFGGPGSKTLYITAGKSLYRIELTVAGR